MQVVQVPIFCGTPSPLYFISMSASKQGTFAWLPRTEHCFLSKSMWLFGPARKLT